MNERTIDIDVGITSISIVHSFMVVADIILLGKNAQRPDIAINLSA